jgi:LPS O-antigen subunit length determinant protein (WzzB/FepE family)
MLEVISVTSILQRRRMQYDRQRQVKRAVHVALSVVIGGLAGTGLAFLVLRYLEKG